MRLHNPPFAGFMALEAEAAEPSEGSFHGERGGEGVDDPKTLERKLRRNAREIDGVH